MDDEDGFRTRTPPGKRSDNVLLTLAREHLALLVPIIGALIFAFRCIIVSAGDPDVAFILVTQTSIGDAIRALFFTVIPLVLFAVSLAAGNAAWTRIFERREPDLKTWYDLVLTWRDRKRTRQDLKTRPDLKAWWRDLKTGWREVKTWWQNHLKTWRDPKTLGMAVASGTLWMGFLYFLGGFQTGLMLSVVVILFLMPLFLSWPFAEGRRTGKQESDRLSRTLVVVALIGFAVFAVYLFRSSLLGKTFWLPREQLVFQNEAPFTGYVLKVSEDYVMILKDKPRVIIERKKDTLDDRDLCHPEVSDEEQVSEKVQSNLPVCP